MSTQNDINEASVCLDRAMRRLWWATGHIPTSESTGKEHDYFGSILVDATAELEKAIMCLRPTCKKGLQAQLGVALSHMLHVAHDNFGADNPFERLHGATAYDTNAQADSSAPLQPDF